MEETNQLEIRVLKDDEIDVVVEHLGLARLFQGDGYYLVGWINGVPAGHAYVAMSDPPEMQDVEVAKAFRRQGVATKLVAAVEAHAASAGASVVRLKVSADGVDAQSLYSLLGFSDSGIAPYRVQGTVNIRTGPLEVDDVLLTWEKPLTTLPASNRGPDATL